MGDPIFTVPYRSDCYQGLLDVQGIVGLDGDAVVFEFEVRDAFLALLRSPIREVRIPISQIETVELVDGWWSSFIRIRGRKLATLESLPGAFTEARLRVKRLDRPRAKSLVAAVDMAMTDRQVEKLALPKGDAELLAR